MPKVTYKIQEHREKRIKKGLYYVYMFTRDTTINTYLHGCYNV